MSISETRVSVLRAQEQSHDYVVSLTSKICVLRKEQKNHRRVKHPSHPFSTLPEPSKSHVRTTSLVRKTSRNDRPTTTWFFSEERLKSRACWLISLEGEANPKMVYMSDISQGEFLNNSCRSKWTMRCSSSFKLERTVAVAVGRFGIYLIIYIFCIQHPLVCWVPKSLNTVRVQMTHMTLELPWRYLGVHGTWYIHYSRKMLSSWTT